MPDSAAAIQRLPVAPQNARASGWWGMVMLIVTEGALFAYLLFSYYYLAAQTPRRWPPDGPLPFGIAFGNTALLLISSVAVIFAERALEISQRKTFLAWQAFAVVLGTVFVGVQLSEWRTKPFTASSHAFGSLYYVITGFHMAHVAVGLFFLVAVWLWTRRGTYDARQHLGVTVSGYYWHFVDLVWLAVFFSLYIYPRML